MELEMYKRVRSAITALIGVVIAYAVLQNSIFIAVAGFTIGMVALLISRSSVAEVTHDERTVLIQNARAHLAILANIELGLNALLRYYYAGRLGG